MPEIQLDVNVANGFAIGVANGVLPVWWMEVNPFLVNQSLNNKRMNPIDLGGQGHNGHIWK